ncbi:hypothetical protein GCM10007043_01650 [Calditerricola satsumensis]|uniref:Uncharacterized protein n=1 Tax=Calditerricola satsumensis TaxID=373054 RepID=A0A8J3F976_9BACI|nr:hypothetical protein GCM10007043_01650 [Calditerricola satsumensis]
MKKFLKTFFSVYSLLLIGSIIYIWLDNEFDVEQKIIISIVYIIFGSFILLFGYKIFLKLFYNLWGK